MTSVVFSGDGARALLVTLGFVCLLRVSLIIRLQYKVCMDRLLRSVRRDELALENKCLAIGVGDAPPLDYLRGAINGARDIAEWANEQGYETRVVTDEKAPVQIDQIRDELDDLLTGGAKRLLLYFAGHGLSTGAADDFWLLSQWNKERRGVSVTALRDRLMRYGIGQLVLVSDACRTLVDSSTSDIEGSSVLFRGSFEEKIPQMDLWFAASPSRAAWMVPGRTPNESRCVFSGLLVEALDGRHADAFDTHSPQLGITNFSLANFMESEVPVLAARYGATLNPVVTTSIRPPNHVYVESGGLQDPNPDDFIPWPDPDDSQIASLGILNVETRLLPNPCGSWTTLGQSTECAGLESLTSATHRYSDLQPPEISYVISRDSNAIARSIARQKKEESRMRLAFVNEHRPTHFDTGSGFSISGASALRSVLGSSATAVLDSRISPEASWWRIEPHSRDKTDNSWSDAFSLIRPQPLLVELSDGRWVGAAVVPGFVLSFTLDVQGAEAVIFRAMDAPYAEETENAMAELRTGALRREQAPDLLARLRQGKHADPMLGVLAAYLHESMGDMANVHRTAYYYAERGEAIPFDIALLGRLAAHRNNDGLVLVEIPSVARTEVRRNTRVYLREATPSAIGVVAGSFPWLRQGWALLDSEGRPDLYANRLSEVAKHLLPSPFTTLDATGGNLLANLLQ